MHQNLLPKPLYDKVDNMFFSQAGLGKTEESIKKGSIMPHIDKQMVSFFLTTKCNLCCEYCYNIDQRAHMQEKTLSFEVAKAGLDYYFSHNGNPHIRFYGPGEPTREFALLKRITEYAKTISKKPLVFEMQTNGCFSMPVCNWLLKNANILWISFDGEAQDHDKNRHFPNGAPSSIIIERNVKYLLANKKDSNLMVGARVTITDTNINRQREIVDYFHTLGIKHVWTDPLFPSVGSIPVCQDAEKQKGYHFDMETYVDNYIKAYHYAQEKDMFYGSILMCNFDGKCTMHCRACLPAMHFTPDGYISACDMVTFGENANHMDCFVYGKWNNEKKGFEFDKNKIEALQNRSIENMPHCKQCTAAEHCGGYCLGEVVNETGSLLGQKKITCDAIRKLYCVLGETNSYPYLHP